jgi:DnaK suppressor protein
MKASTLQTLRRALERERERLAGDVRWTDRVTRELGEAQAEEGPSFGSLGDIASDLAGQEVAVTLARAEHRQLDEVEHALHRLDDGTYGTCETCGAAIDLARLEALPWARFCQRCARERAGAAG